MKIYGIGNPFYDVFCNVENSFFKTHGIIKGKSHHVTGKKASQIFKSLTNYKIVSGGGAFNTLRTISFFGINCEFTGALGKDRKIFEKEKKLNINFNQTYTYSKLDTGKCFYLKSPDNKLTIIASPGAALSFSEQNINFSSLENSDIIFIEGFIFNNLRLKKLSVLHQLKPKKIYIDCGNPFIVAKYKEDIINLAQKHKTTIIGNENEIIAFSKKSVPYSLKILKHYCENIIVKKGEKGAAFLSDMEELSDVPPFLSYHKNTPGCGDLFAAGFITGRIQELSIFNSTLIGNLCGSLCLKYNGGIINPEDAKKVELLINKLKIVNIKRGSDKK